MQQAPASPLGPARPHQGGATVCKSWQADIIQVLILKLAYGWIRYAAVKSAEMRRGTDYGLEGRLGSYGV